MHRIWSAFLCMLSDRIREFRGLFLLCLDTSAEVVSNSKVDHVATSQDQGGSGQEVSTGDAMHEDTLGSDYQGYLG